MEVFDTVANLVAHHIAGCGKKYGMQCSVGSKCFCRSDQQQVVEINQYEQPLQLPSGEEAGAATRSGKSRLSMRMSLGQLSGRMSLGGLSGLGETTFGRAMSGLSALSIDWENMEDFDINVDHSEGINNDIVNAQHQQQQQQHYHSQQQMGDEDANPTDDYEAISPGVGMLERRSSLRKKIPANTSANMNVSFNM